MNQNSNNFIVNWLANYLVHQVIGTKKGDDLENNPVFQSLSGVVIGHIVRQAGLSTDINQINQVIQLVQAGATSGTLPDGFPIPVIKVL